METQCNHKAISRCLTISRNLSLLSLLISCTEKDIPTVRTHEVDSVTNTSVVIKGDVSTGNSTMIVASGVLWDTTENITLALPTKSVSFNSSDQIYHKVEGLSANTKYYARCYASSDWGIGYGNIVTFTTLNQTSDYGGAYLDETDYFIVNQDTCKLGNAFLLWSPEYPKAWKIRFQAWPNSPNYIGYIEFAIYFSGLTPPIKSGAFDLQPELANLNGSHAYLTYSYLSRFSFSMTDFSSLSGQLQVDVINGQVSVTFNNISVKDSSGSLINKLSGHLTCH